MERPFTVDHLDHVVLRVRDLQKSLAFYELLGGKVEEVKRVAGTGVRMAPDQTIILQERPDYAPVGVSALDHIALAIRASDIHEVATYLRTNGVDIAREPRDGGAAPTVNVRDPDDNMIEIRIVR